MAGGNPPTNPPPGPYSGRAYERFKRWYWSHVLHLPRPKRRRIVAYAKGSLRYAGRMHYTEGVNRHDLYHHRKGQFLGAFADCSQFSAALAHWSGVKGVTDTDWTGTLATKGKLVEQPRPGVFVFFGVPPYVHMAVMVSKSRAVGFGSQSGPDDVSLEALLAYFNMRSHPGHAFRDLTQ